MANLFLSAFLIISSIKNYIFNLIHFNSFYYSVLISEYLMMLIPVLFFLILNRYNLKYVLKLNKLSYKQVIIIPLIAVCTVFISTSLNNVMLAILSLFGSFNKLSNGIPSPTSNSQLIIVLLIVALTPAICEEALFRGLIMRCYEQLGIKIAIIMSGVLFGIFHFNVNIQGILGLSFLGIMLAYLVYKTNSIFASVLAHFIFNSFGTSMNYFANYSASATTQIINYKIIVPTIIPSALSTLPVAIICFILLRLLPRSTSSNANINTIYQKENCIKSSIIRYSPLLPIFLLYIYYSSR